MNSRNFEISHWNDKNDPDVLEATSENFRIEIDRVFQEFLADGEVKEHSFPATLNNLERKYVHQRCSTFNLMSRSHGKDPNRILTISKKQNKSLFESFYIDLTDQSKAELGEVVQRIQLRDGHSKRRFVKLSSNEKIFGKLSLGPPPPVAQPRVSPEIQEFQTRLPLYEMKEIVLEKIRNNQVLVISSETGSGKTTQIPQYIMDEARANGQHCRIICTQPRRISAVTVAERVSNERGSNLGETVGYHIRLESKLGTSSNLIYCTNGVLIRSLMSGDQVLSTLTHIIIDEVHERDKLSDFLLVCLKENIAKGTHIKIILMSATINVEKFHRYFDQAEMLQVPGRLFPISQLFLDDVLELTGYDKVLMKKFDFCNKNTSPQNPQLTQNNFSSAEAQASASSSDGGASSSSSPSTSAGGFSAGGIMADGNPQFDEIITDCFQLLTDVDNSEQVWTQLLQFLLNEDMPVNYQHSESGMTALMAAVYNGEVGLVEQLLGLGADPKIQAKNGMTALNIARNQDHDEIILLLTKEFQETISREDILTSYYKTVADEDINYELLVRLICTIHNFYQQGAILVFLPGYDDIMMCYEHILNADLDSSTYKVFFLHGSMNIKEQHQLFQPIPVRKIILSTNIAETSLTIDDVVFVIDSGKAKVQSYDSCSGLSSLQVQWISKACVKQRAGRAGRTQSGICFHLFSKLRYQSFLDERVPEILRVPLEELCLNTKTLAGNAHSIHDFLVKAPDPPTPNSVRTAVENLECLGALDKDENLTPLGEYLSQLTIEPHLGKMLIYAVIFKCLDPIMTIVASLAQKDPFQLPPQASLRSSAAEKRKSLTIDTCSDHMVYLKAFIKWQESVRLKKERSFCRDFFISPSTMETILKTRFQLLGQLRAAKFVPPHGDAMMGLNTSSENWPLVKAVISSGLYPKLAFKINKNFCTRTEKKIMIHNSSPLSRENVSLWLVYDEMVKSRCGNQIRGVTPVTPITISLMCGIKSETLLQNHMTIDEWLEFEFPNEHVIHLRKCLENLVAKKLCSPLNPLTTNEEMALNALGNILMNEDKAMGMILPTGIKHKPKFFEVNKIMQDRALMNGRAGPRSNSRSQNANNSNGPSPSTSSLLGPVPSTISRPYLVGGGAPQGGPRPFQAFDNTTGGRTNHHHHFTGATNNNGRHMHFSSNVRHGSNGTRSGGNGGHSSFNPRLPNNGMDLYQNNGDSNGNAGNGRQGQDSASPSTSNGYYFESRYGSHNQNGGAGGGGNGGAGHSRGSKKYFNGWNLGGNSAGFQGGFNNAQQSKYGNGTTNNGMQQQVSPFQGASTSCAGAAAFNAGLDNQFKFNFSINKMSMDAMGAAAGTSSASCSTSSSGNGPVGGEPDSNCLFLLIRVKQENSIKIAYESNKWVFSPQTEKQIISLDNAGVTVYLLYTVHRMNTFYGIAQFMRLDQSKAKLQGHIEWKFRVTLPYKKVNHLRNPHNGNRLIFEGSDGQEVAPEVARQLWELFSIEEQKQPPTYNVSTAPSGGRHFKY